MTFGAANACMALDRGTSWSSSSGSSSSSSKGNKQSSEQNRKIDKLTKQKAELEAEIARLQTGDDSTSKDHKVKPQTSTAAASATAKKTQRVEKTTFYTSSWDGGYGLL